MTLPDEKRRDPKALYNKMTLKELKLKIPDINWVELTNTYLPEHLHVILWCMYCMRHFKMLRINMTID